MSTKEAYEQEMYYLEQAEPDGFRNPSRIRDYVAAKEAEIAELWRQLKEADEANTAWVKNYQHVKAELAAVKGERDEQAKFARYWKVKVEAAPKVWMWWEKDVKGVWFPRRCSDRKGIWDGCTMHDGIRVEQVSAVTVEEEK